MTDRKKSVIVRYVRKNIKLCGPVPGGTVKGNTGENPEQPSLPYMAL